MRAGGFASSFTRRIGGGRSRNVRPEVRAGAGVCMSTVALWIRKEVSCCPLSLAKARAKKCPAAGSALGADESTGQPQPWPCDPCDYGHAAGCCNLVSWRWLKTKCADALGRHASRGALTGVNQARQCSAECVAASAARHRAGAVVAGTVGTAVAIADAFVAADWAAACATNACLAALRPRAPPSPPTRQQRGRWASQTCAR